MTSPTHDDIEQLARAVVRANGNALLIDENNGSGQWVSIGEAVASSQAFAVEPKQSLIALDLDTPELIEQGEQAATFAADSGFPVLWVASGRNRHLYVNAGEHRAVVEEHLRELLPLDAFRTGRAIRPPLVPHRLGNEVALISPETVCEALTVLGEPEQPAKLPQWAQRLLVHGGGDDRSAMALILASAFKRAGFSFDDYERAMLNSRNAGGEKAQELDDKRQDPNFLRRTWDKANGDLLTVDHTRELLDRVRQSVHVAEWAGVRGRSDRKVMLALLDYASSVPTLAPTPGERRLTELAQLGCKKTTRQALNRLADQGWISREPSEEGYSWRINVKLHTHSVTGGNGNTMGGLLYIHPVFRRGTGLGDVPGLVWSYLHHAGESRTADIHSAVGVSRQSVDNALKRLVSFGLAEKVGHGRYAAIGDEPDLDRLASDLGVYDRMQQVAEVHELERGQWEARKDEWRCPVVVEPGDVCGEWKHKIQPDCGRHMPEPADEALRRLDDEWLMEQVM